MFLVTNENMGLCLCMLGVYQCMSMWVHSYYWIKLRNCYPVYAGLINKITIVMMMGPNETIKH